MYSFVVSLSSDKATTEADAVVNTLRHKRAPENIWYSCMKRSNEWSITKPLNP